jgi:hypothetical protein
MSIKLNRRSFFSTLLVSPFIAKVNVFAPKKETTIPSGYIDSIKIWNGDPTREEIINLYCSTSPVKR